MFAAIHLFDKGLGPIIATAFFVAFMVSVITALLSGRRFWGAVADAPGGSGMIELADNLSGLWNFYDAFMLKHMGIIATTEQWVIIREYAQEVGQEIDEEKARLLVEDFMPALSTDVLREKVAANRISAEDYAMADRVAAHFPDIQALTNRAAADTATLLELPGGESVQPQQA